MSRPTWFLFYSRTSLFADLAKKYGKPPSQILLRWSTQRGIGVIPKSGNSKRLAQNLNVTDFEMSKEDLKVISGLKKYIQPFNVSYSLLEAQFDTIADFPQFGERHPIFA